jgi:hypothetical protein
MTPQLLAPVGCQEMPDSQSNLVQPYQRIWAAGLTKIDAEDLLDWLDSHGNNRCQVSYVAGEGFVVTELSVWQPGNGPG